jgi:uncharacterized membrane protein
LARVLRTRGGGTRVANAVLIARGRKAAIAMDNRSTQAEANMTKTVVGSFDSYREAQQVVQDLQRANVPHADISIVASNLRGEYRTDAAPTGYSSTASTAGVGTAGTTAADVATEDRTSGAATGAVTGGVIGGVAGLALAFTSLTIPVLGPIIAAGPLVAALTGAGVGAVAGGLIGGLTDLGVSEEHAKYYAESVRRGGALVTVRADEARADEVSRLMQQHGAIDINKRAETWRTSGWEGFDTNARPYTVDDLERERGVSTRATMPRSSSDWSLYADEFRADFDRDYAGRGARYEEYEPAYRWGFENADNYRGRDWTSAEADMRRDWEASNPDGDWERFKDAVRRGWDRFTSKVERAVGADNDTRRTRV